MKGEIHNKKCSNPIFFL
uniref:Uncharacterized protein n=1 Tax=Arundo donax TaxID=35708 RepID=A0A0A9ASZ3_ARUDO